MLYDGMPYDPIQGQGHHFQSHSASGILTASKFVQAGFLTFIPVFVSLDFELEIELHHDGLIINIVIITFL